MKKFSFCFLLLALILLIFSCPPPQQTTESKKITITDLGWVLDNIDYSYWSSTPPAHAFFYFDIQYSGSDISSSDVSSIKITGSDNVYWSSDLANYTFDTQNKVIIPPRCYEGDSIDSLPIGNFKVEIKLTNGTTASFDKLIPAPNSTGTNGYSRVYTEDISAPSNSTLLVRRPSLGAHNNDGTALTINFSINDPIVYNGYIWLYDSSNSYIGISTTKFRNSSNVNLSSIINNGAAFNIDGNNNTITLTNGDITYQSGKSFSDINKFIVVLTDGAQYAPQGKYSSYDCRSISAKTQF